MLASKIRASDRKRRSSSGSPDKVGLTESVSADASSLDKRLCMDSELNCDDDTPGQQQQRQHNQDDLPTKTVRSLRDGAGDICTKGGDKMAEDQVEDALPLQTSLSACTRLPDRPAQTLAQVMKEIGHEASLLQSTWAEMFTESESFELFCPKRLEKILSEVKELEKNLLEQKEVLRQRLQVLSQMLNV